MDEIKSLIETLREESRAERESNKTRGDVLDQRLAEFEQAINQIKLDVSAAAQMSTPQKRLATLSALTTIQDDGNGSSLAAHGGVDYNADTRRAMKPNIYDGCTSWEEYVVQFDIIAEGNGWSKEQKATQLAVKLKGDALSVLANLPARDRRDWDKLADALATRFEDKYQGRVSHALLRNRVQQPKEELAVFAFDVEKLTRLAFKGCASELQDQVALMQFIDGIYDLRTQEQVRAADPPTLKLALAKAFEFSAIQKATNMTRRAVREVNVIPDQPEESLTDNPQQHSLKSRWRRSRRRYPSNKNGEANFPQKDQQRQQRSPEPQQQWQQRLPEPQRPQQQQRPWQRQPSQWQQQQKERQPYPPQQNKPQLPIQPTFGESYAEN